MNKLLRWQICRSKFLIRFETKRSHTVLALSLAYSHWLRLALMTLEASQKSVAVHNAIIYASCSPHTTRGSRVFIAAFSNRSHKRSFVGLFVAFSLLGKRFVDFRKNCNVRPSDGQGRSVFQQNARTPFKATGVKKQTSPLSASSLCEFKDCVFPKVLRRLN